MGTVIEWTHPVSVMPPHEVRDQNKYEALVISMTSHGWRGRPLLAIGYGDGTYQALTGSHRIQAAIDTGLESIPVQLVLTPEVVWDLIDEHGAFDQDELLDALEEAGDIAAVDLLTEEPG